MPKRLPPVGFYAIALTVALLDQLVKAIVVRTLPVGVTGSVPLWPGVFHLTHVQNPGIAFSLLEGKLPIITGAALIVMGILVAAERRARGRLPFWHGVALALPLGGALGNLTDRLRLGYVTDFLDFRLINFPVFNVADSAITIGIALLAWRTMTTPSPAPRPTEGDARDASGSL